MPGPILTSGDTSSIRYLLRTGSSGKSRSFRRLRSARGMAVSLSLAALVSMVGGQIHALAVTHVRCAAHGELEHTDQSAATLVEATEPVIERASPTVVLAHEHCALATVFGRSLSYRRTIAVVTLLTPPARSERPPAITAPRPLHARATVRLAPKTSPPSV
jgi:hypothetical protein